MATPDKNDSPFHRLRSALARSASRRRNSDTADERLLTDPAALASFLKGRPMAQDDIVASNQPGPINPSITFPDKVADTDPHREASGPPHDSTGQGGARIQVVDAELLEVGAGPILAPYVKAPKGDQAFDGLLKFDGVVENTAPFHADMRVRTAHLNDAAIRFDTDWHYARSVGPGERITDSFHAPSATSVVEVIGLELHEVEGPHLEGDLIRTEEGNEILAVEDAVSEAPADLAASHDSPAVLVTNIGTFTGTVKVRAHFYDDDQVRIDMDWIREPRVPVGGKFLPRLHCHEATTIQVVEVVLEAE